MSTELSIIVPTFNERDNIVPLIEALDPVLEGINWELIFVDDDSPDGTSSHVRKIASDDRRVRCIQRIKRRGLSSACIEGILASSSPYICIMDADMQHDERIIPQMYTLIKQDALDIVIGSRYTGEGSTGELPKHRKSISLLATRISHVLLGVKVTDPMSGFFMISREYFEKVMYSVSGRGFKILLDMLASSKGFVRTREVPYTMRSRVRGQSKLDLLVVWDFMMLVLSRFAGNIVPHRLISFLTVGFTGLFVHLLILWLLHDLSSLGFTLSQTVATFVAMTSNYYLNNIFTYYDSRRTGKDFWKGLLGFYLVCMLGAILNVALATELYTRQVPWMAAGIFGAVAGAIWNFTVSGIFVWGRDSKTSE